MLAVGDLASHESCNRLLRVNTNNMKRLGFVQLCHENVFYEMNAYKYSIQSLPEICITYNIPLFRSEQLMFYITLETMDPIL